MDGFAKRIKELRIKKGYTQAELGMMLDISPSAIGMYE
ncbi:MAG: helix-turn-helix transcriptional regulator, partial [Clostridia bacterium]|nr:helix-turn-helix transcriptional regulator [Clostridia bacterium]